jgi:hypothetical protein
VIYTCVMNIETLKQFLIDAQNKLILVSKSPKSKDLCYPFREDGRIWGFREGLTKIEYHFRSHMRQLKYKPMV